MWTLSKHTQNKTTILGTPQCFIPLSYFCTGQYFTLSAEDPETAAVTGTTHLDPTPPGSKVERGGGCKVKDL
jgi:hypothetical protein